MAKISKIYLKNYKSLRDIELELKPLNILIGTNGSGKSNLLDFFRLLKDAADGQLSRHINREGGFNDVRWWGERKETEHYISINVDLNYLEMYKETEVSKESFKHKIILINAGSTARIFQETVTDERNIAILDIEFSVLKHLVGGSFQPTEQVALHKLTQNYVDSQFFVSQFNDPISFHPVLNFIQRTYSDLSIYNGFSTESIENVHQAQTLDALYPLRLEPDLSNLASILHALQNDARYETALADLTDYLNPAFPEINKFDTPQSAAGKIELRWRNKDFQGKSLPAFSMSDGMIRFLGLATLLVLPDPPSLIAIDEPEIGLHPKLIPLLASLLKEASKRTQIVVTTHSPELLNSEAITLDDIVLVNKEDGATTFERPNAERLERWLENYSIGQLWMMGNLEQP